MTYEITSRWFERGVGVWNTATETHENVSMQEAWRRASVLASGLDKEYGDDHFWSVRLQNAHGESIVELFHGRLI